MKKLLFGAMAFCAVGAQAVVIYDSNGFESPTFVGSAAGTNLSGQNGWLNATSASGTTAHVLNAPDSGVSPCGGSQMVRLRSTTAGSTRWMWPDISAGVASAVANGQNVISMTSCFYVRSGGGFDAVSGIQAYDAAVNYLAGIEVNTSGGVALTNGSVSYTFSGLSLDTWHTMRLDVDHGANVARGWIDSFSLGTVPLELLEGLTTDFDLVIVGGTGASTANPARTYFDDYKVQAVPEPSAVVALSAGVLCLARRRRKA